MYTIKIGDLIAQVFNNIGFRMYQYIFWVLLRQVVLPTIIVMAVNKIWKRFSNILVNYKIIRFLFVLNKKQMRW